mgnify:CR=1 FL=1
MEFWGGKSVDYCSLNLTTKLVGKKAAVLNGSSI